MLPATSSDGNDDGEKMAGSVRGCRIVCTWPVEPATAYRGNDNNGDDVVLQVKITTLLYCFSAQFLAKGRPNG